MRNFLILAPFVGLSSLVLISIAPTDSAAPPVRGPGILYVDDSSTNGLNDGSSWKNAYRYLQDALHNASTNGAISEVWVAEGIYKPDQGRHQTPGDRTASFHLLPGVSIYGGFAGTETSLDERDFRAHPTILSGDLLGDDGPGYSNRAENAYHVLIGAASTLAILSGVSIHGGSATGTGDLSYGGGLFMAWGTATILDCQFEGNTAVRGGGIYNQGGRISLINCRFAGNRSVRSGSARAPVAEGGAVFNASSIGAVSITQCVLQCNSADSGGGALCNLGCATVTHSTVAGNSAPVTGGLRTASLASPGLTVRNSILWGNSDSTGQSEGAQIARASQSAPVNIGYTSIQGWLGSLGGTGNQGGDPRFLSGGVDFSECGEIGTGPLFDLRLSASSPAIDAGDAGADADVCFGGIQPIPTNDLSGFDRLVDDPSTPDTGVGLSPFVDLGPYEFQPYDCNYNGVLDSEDIDIELSLECNSNGIPDECEAPRITRVAELVPDDSAGSGLGRALAIDGDTLVAVPYSSRSAYVFRRSTNGWFREAELRAPLQYDGFRPAVSISGDVVFLGVQESSPPYGAAYVFRRVNAEWIYETRLGPLNGRSSFGQSVAVYGDVAVVGAPPSGNPSPDGDADVFRFDGVRWAREARLVPSNPQTNGNFGSTVAAGPDTLVVTGYVFRYNGANWQEEASLNLSGAVALSGNRIVVRTIQSLQVFRRDGATWLVEGTLEALPQEAYGFNSLSISGDLVLGCISGFATPPESGYGVVYLFRYDGQWTLEARIVITDPTPYVELGTAAGISGHSAVISSVNAANPMGPVGKLYIFEIRTDCNSNGLLDSCESDCNANLAADSCDIASGRSFDCDEDDMPDECAVALGTARDCNHSNIPDECEGIPRADLDCDADVDADDLAIFRDCHLLPAQPVTAECSVADLNADGRVDCADWRILRDTWTVGAAPDNPRCRTPSAIGPATAE